MPVSDSSPQKNQRRRKTKAQLIDELDSPDRRIAILEGSTGVPAVERHAKNQLANAIEHLDEGVALFDADDRLVHCNTRYLSEISPDLVGEFRPGMRFEELVRIATVNGYFLVEGRSAESLIQERIAARTSGQDWQEMQLADGDWVAFREYAAPGGRNFFHSSEHDAVEARRGTLAAERRALSFSIENRQ